MDENSMALVCDFDSEVHNLAGWYLSEKLDGCRAYWDGKAFYTRAGNPIHAPDYITSAMPAEEVDGEIWAGRGGFQKARVAVQFGTADGKHWDGVRFVAFDYPQRSGDWLDRMDGNGLVCRSTKQAFHLMRYVQANGGEGIIARQPAMQYRAGRSGCVLRLK
jgi:DNA ligase-1